jgi:hypothetical protein
MIQTRPLEIKDFSGGVTDLYFDGLENSGEVVDNMVLNVNKKLQARHGFALDDTDNPQTPAGAQRTSTLINYDNNDTLFVQSAKKLYYRNPSAYTTLTGPTGNDVFSSGDTSSIISHTQWAGHLILCSDEYVKPQKVYKDNTSTVQVRTAGLPSLASDPTVTAGAAGSNNYLYAFCYAYTYFVGSVQFLDRGVVRYVELTSAAAPNTNAVSITNIPVISNGSTDNYDTTAIKVEIYRTINNGSTLYKVGEVTNGTTTASDNVADTTAQDNEVIYVEGGVFDNDPPPLAKYVHVVNNVAYYGDIKDGTEIRTNRIRQSVQNDVDSCPLAFTDDLEDDIRGISSTQGIPIVLCNRYIYRLEGIYDELGRGGIYHTRISDHAGCISHNSVVQAEGGIFWAGVDGFYYSDGYKCYKISNHLNETYKIITDNMGSNSGRITGTYDANRRLIFWSVAKEEGAVELDSCFILDLKWGLKPECTFVTMSSEGVEDNFIPTAITYFNNDIYHADTRGYVFHHSEDYAFDDLVDTSKSVSLWGKAAIVWRYRSMATNFGSTFQRKFVPRILVTAKNEGNVSIQVKSINDDRDALDLIPIRVRDNLVWGDDESWWGDEDLRWNYDAVIEEWRRFPKNNLRCSYKQIEITNANTIITNSDTLGDATVDSVLSTVTLDAAPNLDWPEYAEGYTISFASDGYTTEYNITNRTDNILTIEDPDGSVPSGSQPWVIKGVKKGEFIHLLSYTLHWSQMSDSQKMFTGETGANA